MSETLADIKKEAHVDADEAFYDLFDYAVRLPSYDSGSLEKLKHGNTVDDAMLTAKNPNNSRKLRNSARNAAKVCNNIVIDWKNEQVRPLDKNDIDYLASKINA